MAVHSECNSSRGALHFSVSSFSLLRPLAGVVAAAAAAATDASNCGFSVCLVSIVRLPCGDCPSLLPRRSPLSRLIFTLDRQEGPLG
jgi:hypothetical protein